MQQIKSVRFYLIFPLLLAILLALPLLGCDQENDSEKAQYLSFTNGNVISNQFTLKDLQKKLKSQKVEVYDITFQKNKKYAAFKLADVLDAAYGSAWRGDKAILVFAALDTYTVSFPGPRLAESGGFIAFDDLDVAGWERFPTAVAPEGNAAPFYAVWQGESQRDETKYPWHFQLAIVNLRPNG